MPFDFSRFLRSVETRARLVRGAGTAGVVLALASAGSVAAMVIVRLLRVALPLWALSLFVVPPLVATLLAYVAGRMQRPRIPQLLLRIDDALGLAARLSALYELRQRPSVSIFRERLESEVSDAIGDWQTALPIGRRTVLGGSVGLCGVALAVGLAFVPLPEPPPSPLERLAAASGAADEDRSLGESTSPAPIGEVEAPETLVTTPDAAEGASSAALDTPERDETLEDVMRDLAAGMTPNEAVLVPLEPEDIEGLAQAQSEAMRAVVQLLESIQERLENAPPSDPPQLTDEELEDLQRKLDRGGIPPDLQEGLNELMDPSPSRTVEEIVEQLMDQFGDEESTESETEGSDQLPQTTALPPDRQSIEDALDDFAAPPGEGGPGAEDAGPGGADGGEAPDDSNRDGPESLGGPSDVAGDRGIEDPNQLGGTDGPGGPPGEDHELEAGFIREEESGRIGSEGDFVSEFVTEGVPIEVVPHADDGSPAFRVRYDRIDSILRERGVPEGAIDIVRDYFNAITEGES
jgi:hypothetical protein